MDEIGKIDGAHLVLQVHMDKAPGLDEEALRAGCQKLVEAGWAARLSFVRSQEDGDHIDAGFEQKRRQSLSFTAGKDSQILLDKRGLFTGLVVAWGLCF